MSSPLQSSSPLPDTPELDPSDNPVLTPGPVANPVPTLGPVANPVPAPAPNMYPLLEPVPNVNHLLEPAPPMDPSPLSAPPLYFQPPLPFEEFPPPPPCVCHFTFYFSSTYIPSDGKV